MPPHTIHLKFSEFLRHRSMVDLYEAMYKHPLLCIGMYTKGRHSKLTDLVYITRAENCPSDVTCLDTTVDFYDLRRVYNSADAYRHLTARGAIRVRVVDHRLTGANAIVYRMWMEKPNHAPRVTSATITPLPRPVVVPPPVVHPPQEVSADILFKPVPLRVRPHLVPPPVPSDGLDDHQKVRTAISRGVDLGTPVGQSFALSGIVSVELNPAEHTEEQYTLIEGAEVEAILTRALKRAYGTRIKTLRLRITGT